MQIEIAEVKITSRPVRALFNHFFDEQGHFIPDRKPAFKKEVGIISVRFNTVELLVVRDKKSVQRRSFDVVNSVQKSCFVFGRYKPSNSRRKTQKRV